MRYMRKLDRFPERPSGEPGHDCVSDAGLEVDLTRVKLRSTARHRWPLPAGHVNQPAAEGKTERVYAQREEA